MQIVRISEIYIGEAEYMKNNHIEQQNMRCVGCNNCAHVCPCSAITMTSDKEGFFYPKVDEKKCVECGRCKEVCQIYKKHISNSFPKESYAVISKNIEIYKRAASGGVFGTLANAVLKEKLWSVCGATYKDGKVQHVIIDSDAEVCKLQNSRYVQSDLGDIFRVVRDKLNQGESVLFSGTPCQIYALKLFVGDQKRLFTIDIVCHGVPSAKLLSKDLEIYSKTVNDVKFRLKKRIRPSLSYFVMTIESNGKEQHVFNNRDPYFSLFMSGVTYRESCYMCSFANLSRVGDLTIGDCDSYKYFEDFHKGESFSTVLVNTEKGKLIWDMFSDCFDFCCLDVEREANCNAQLSHPVHRSPIRDVIYDEILEGDIKSKKTEYCKKRDWKEKMMLLKMGILK